MPRFAANLTMLWPELDVYDRFRAAAQAGFRRVEILFVHPLDPYHVGMAGGDARAALKRYSSLVRHVQIADVPGRNQPGTGKQPIPDFLRDLDDLGYTGNVGLEYRPRGAMDIALAWLPPAAR